MALVYHNLTDDLEMKISNDRKNGWENPFRTDDKFAVRRLNFFERDSSSILRPPYVRDIEKILHLPIYNRYSDKTQVFSFYNNDDISRRSLHVQLVSRIARNIGRVLGLNLDLIEAISLGHDLGHTPFGHAGEKYLSELYYAETGRYFNHNVHSVRVLDKVFKRNVTLQTLDGILCHNGEVEKQIYSPSKQLDFASFDAKVDSCYAIGLKAGDSLNPSTLEGCLVRVCDMIAYLGKDRQDAVKANIISDLSVFSPNDIGTDNADIINNISIDIIQNSYGENYIKLSDDIFQALRLVKQENYSNIYKNESVSYVLETTVKPMFSEVFYKLLSDIKSNNIESVIYKHHIDYIKENTKYYGDFDYLSESPVDIVVDFIAAMTDDYFIDLYEFLFPNKQHAVIYKSYFNGIKV